MGFDHLDRKLRIVAIDSLHGLLNGKPFVIFPDQLAIDSVDIHIFQ